MTIREVKPQDKDYPLVMKLVPNAEKYDLFDIDGCTFVPLYQVIDALTVVKPDIIVRNGERFCANCGVKMEDEKCK